MLHPELTPWWSFPLADGDHHKKPHSPTRPRGKEEALYNFSMSSTKFQYHTGLKLTVSIQFGQDY